jgi:Malectin domain
MRFLLFLAALTCAAQTLAIVSGSTADQYYVGGASYTNADLTTLRYAPAFSYSIPLTNGLYKLTLHFDEPNKTAARQRLFTVSANGQTTEPLDVFALAGGALRSYSRDMLVLVGAGTLKIQLTATLGNAILSGVEINPAALSMNGLVVQNWLDQWTACTAHGPLFDCAGLFYVRIHDRNGTAQELVGVEISASYPLDVSSWQSLIPAN